MNHLPFPQNGASSHRSVTAEVPTQGAVPAPPLLPQGRIQGWIRETRARKGWPQAEKAFPQLVLAEVTPVFITKNTSFIHSFIQTFIYSFSRYS